MTFEEACAVVSIILSNSILRVNEELLTSYMSHTTFIIPSHTENRRKRREEEENPFGKVDADR